MKADALVYSIVTEVLALTPINGAVSAHRMMRYVLFEILYES